jgi:hypothetical protein
MTRWRTEIMEWIGAGATLAAPALSTKDAAMLAGVGMAHAHTTEGITLTVLAATTSVQLFDSKEEKKLVQTNIQLYQSITKS